MPLIFGGFLLLLLIVPRGTDKSEIFGAVLDSIGMTFGSFAILAAVFLIGAGWKENHDAARRAEEDDEAVPQRYADVTTAVSAPGTLWIGFGVAILSIAALVWLLG